MDKKARKEVYGQVEELEKALDNRRAELGLEESAMMRKDSRVGVEGAGQRKARALLWAHLLRYELDAGLKSGMSHFSQYLFDTLGSWETQRAHGCLQ